MITTPLTELLERPPRRKRPLPAGFKPLEDWCDYERTHPELQRAWQAASDFAADLARRGEPARWLSLLGVSGCGKTMLAKAVRQSVLHHRPESTCAFFKWTSVVNRYLRQGDYGIIPYLAEDVDVLVLDDIGLETGSSFSNAKLGELLDARLGKWTLLTSNLLLADISEQIDMRVASRLVRGESEVVQLVHVPDWSFEAYKRRPVR